MIEKGTAFLKAKGVGLATRRWKLAATALILLLVTSGLAWGLSASRSDRIEEKDFVHFHFSIYDQEGTMVYTTDPEVAKRAIAQGNDVLNPNLSAKQYTLRSGYVQLDPVTAEGPEDTRIEVSRQFIGYREGDTIYTGYMVNPYGPVNRYEIPTTIGPIQMVFDLNLTEAYAEPTRNYTIEQFGDRPAFFEGARFPYRDVLEVTVTELQGDVATLKVVAEDDSRIYSYAFGFNLTVENVPDTPDIVFLHPDVAVGGVFTTRGCELPFGYLPPGRYRVEDVGENNFTVVSTPEVGAALLDATLRFEFEIVNVEKWTGIRQAKETVAPLISKLQSVPNLIHTGVRS